MYGEAAIEDFLGQSVDEIRRYGMTGRSLRVAFVLVDRAMYPQRHSAWVAESEREYVSEVLGHAIRSVGYDDLGVCVVGDLEVEERYWLAAILTTRALHVHKSKLRRELVGWAERTAAVRRDLDRAAEILDGLLLQDLVEGVDRDDVELLRGRVDSLRSMSFLNGRPQDVGLAVEYGELALRRRATAAERDPGSLQKRRMVTASGWNLCDAMMLAAEQLGDVGERRKYWERVRDRRGEVVRQAESILREDFSFQSLTDYAVNSSRLIWVNLLLGEDGIAESQFRELRALTGPGSAWWEFDTGVNLLVPAAGVWVREGTAAAEEDLTVVIRWMQSWLSRDTERLQMRGRLKLLQSGRERLWEQLRVRSDWREFERSLGAEGE
jgi:hypothetical protein